MKKFDGFVWLIQSVAAARERTSAEDVSSAAKPASEGGRWWLQSWFPDWSGWYGAQQPTDVQPPGTESLCATTENEKALGNNTFTVCLITFDVPYVM